jgi:AbrB family looped-hinge helix DNA binding protein
MARVDSKGRVVLPKSVRERLGLDPGTEVEIVEEGGKVVVRPECAPEDVIGTMESLVEEAAAKRESRRRRISTCSLASTRRRSDRGHPTGRLGMGEAEGPFLFDVGVVALAHGGTPVSEPALAYLRDAIAGEIDGVMGSARRYSRPRSSRY